MIQYIFLQNSISQLQYSRTVWCIQAQTNQMYTIVFSKVPMVPPIQKIGSKLAELQYKN